MGKMDEENDLKEQHTGMKTDYKCPDCEGFMYATKHQDWVRCLPCKKSFHRDKIQKYKHRMP